MAASIVALKQEVCHDSPVAYKIFSGVMCAQQKNVDPVGELLEIPLISPASRHLK